MKKIVRHSKPDRLLPAAHAARLFRVRPDPSRPFVVEVRISTTQRRMREEIVRCGKFPNESDREFSNVAGMVRSYHRKGTTRAVALPGQILARMFLNVKDLRERPSEIVAHECGHAAMAWARYQRANLQDMSGEEVMCYALGRLVQQVNRVCYAHGVWP